MIWESWTLPNKLLPAGVPKTIKLKPVSAEKPVCAFVVLSEKPEHCSVFLTHKCFLLANSSLSGQRRVIGAEWRKKAPNVSAVEQFSCTRCSDGRSYVGICVSWGKCFALQLWKKGEKFRALTVSYSQHMAVICWTVLPPCLPPCLPPSLSPSLPSLPGKNMSSVEQQDILCVVCASAGVCMCAVLCSGENVPQYSWVGVTQAWPSPFQSTWSRTGPACVSADTPQDGPHVFVCQGECTFHTCVHSGAEVDAALSCFAGLWLAGCSLQTLGGWRHSWAVEHGAQGFTQQCRVRGSTHRGTALNGDKHSSGPTLTDTVVVAERKLHWSVHQTC